MTGSDNTIGHDLDISFLAPEKSSTLVAGKVNLHVFVARIVPDDAPNRGCLAGTRILVLSIRRMTDSQTVFEWNRGTAVSVLDESVRALGRFLAYGLASCVERIQESVDKAFSPIEADRSKGRMERQRYFNVRSEYLASVSPHAKKHWEVALDTWDKKIEEFYKHEKIPNLRLVATNRQSRGPSL